MCATDRLIRKSILTDAENWAIDETGRFLIHIEGTRLVRRVTDENWAVAFSGIGQVRLGYITQLVITAAVRWRLKNAIQFKVNGSEIGRV